MTTAPISTEFSGFSLTLSHVVVGDDVTAWADRRREAQEWLHRGAVRKAIAAAEAFLSTSREG